MFGETIRLSFRAILRNALRSILTVLGIVIGVGAVIVMVTVGQGSTAQVTDDVATLGSNLLMVQPGQARRGPAVAGAPADNFTIKDVDAIESQIPGVLAAAPTNARAMTAIAGNANHATTVTGSDNRYFVARDWVIAGGRDFTESELRLGTAVCILGETVREELFGSSDPVGAIIRLKQISCRVVGLLAKKGASAFGNDQDDAIIMPLRAFQRRIAGNRDVAMMFVAVRDGYETAKVQSDVENLMRERRRIALGETDNFNVLDMKEVASILTSITTVLTGLLAAVAGVSLLVGGIGIMNIMLVSVTERTREIGIRLAVGAEARQVLMQFLVEAVVLSLFGGILGILVGFGLGAVAANLLEVPFAVDPTIVAVAFLFSAAVGVIFGYFPARRAARMNPIEALRHE